MLLSGRIDTMAGVDQTFYWAIKEMQLDPLKPDTANGNQPAEDRLFISKKSSHLDRIPA
jgi:hypothetical protein